MAKKASKSGIFKRIFKWLFKVFIYFIVATVFITLLFRFVPIPATPLMVIRVFQQFSDDKEIKLNKDWVSFDEISKNAPLAVIASEDQKFLEHWGFDYESIQKAMKDNKKKKNKRGASTISQQTAKNVFLWPQRSWVRKGFEVYFTFLIEMLWSKERIIEVYLNVAEFGDGIYGVEMASQKFFNKPASKLSRSEAALLAAVLPNPRKFNARKPSSYIQSRKQWILGQMNNIEPIIKFE